MKKRGLASLLIVSIIAIAAVFGVVFAFQNAGRETDVYGSVTVTVDKPNIELEIELEKDTTGDKKFRIIKTPSSSAYFTITVGGLPDSADRAVELNESSISSGMVSVTRVTPLAESGKTGINTFMVNGENGGAPITMTFTTRSGGQTVAVNVNVKMIAKDMKVASSSHFGIRQGGDDLNLMSTDILNKFIFFAHPEDSERKYTPNNFPVQYRLKDEALYPGVILRDGILSVTEAASCVDQYIYVQAKLPAMDETEWIDVPFYVFPKADNIIVKTNAYKAANTAANVWDLIANRTEFSSANFEFELDCLKTGLSDYGFEVRSADPQIVRVDHVDQYQRSLSTVQNLGEVAINITAYPIIKDGGKEIYFNDETDANVKVQDTIYIRARNEFHTQDEAGIYGTESFHLTSSKETLNAFYYEGNHYSQAYFDVFDIDTFNGKTVNLDTEVEFELVVEDYAGDMSGNYGWNPAENPDQTIGLFSVLQIGYWSNKANDWVMLSGEANNYYAHYLNRFCVSFMRTANAQKFLSPNMELKLRVKTVNKLTIDEYAICDIDLDATSAVDKFEVTNLTEFEDGGLGIALVYDTKQQSFSYQEVNVYGKIAKNSANGSIRYENSKKWNTAKVTDDRGDLPFEINSVKKDSNDLHYLTYRITGNNIGAIEYYKDYPLTLEYPNGTTFTFNVRVYPTVETLTMSAISNSRGKIHKTITYDDNSEYDYVRTMYVRKGYTYELAVDTQGVTVGAYAMFDSVRDENGNVISSTTSKMIDARNLAEGLYECSVSLHAYSNEVYGNNKRANIIVYVVVVNPVGNVVIPENVKLEGINDSAEIALEMTSLENKPITDDAYLYIEVAEPLNPNVAVEQGSKFNRFRITAKYLMEDVFNVGFKIYKSYNFPAKFDLDGRAWTENEAVVFNYVGGAVINTKVSITNSKPNKVIIAEGVKESANIGNYLELVSGPEAVVESEVKIGVADDAKYKAYGLAVVQWKNGQFVLDPFALKEGELAVGDCAVARIGAQTGNIYIKPVADKTSMGVYGLVVYASDSLRYVGVDNDGNDLVLPDVYQVISLYVGTAEDIKATVDDLNSGVPHDANSGQRNTRGGYNWIWKSTTPGAAVAILFYTPGAETNNGFQANMYYVDDLYTVLGWPGLKNPDKLTLTKFVDNAPVGGNYVIKKENGRLRIDLDRKYDNDDTVFYSGYFNQDQTIYTTVKFEVHNDDTGAVYQFYVVKGLNTFDVMIQSTGVGSGLVARKNLNPKEYANAIDSVTMQRGNKFNFIADMDSGWELNSHNFDAAENERTGRVTYAGGTYTFTPKIKIGGHEFDVDALTATVKVNVKGGVNYLNISQDSVTLDGVTTAAYDLTMRSDQKIWSPSLLNYKFLYDGVYYDLFENDETVSYINMEGGKSKLEFKLKCLNEDPVPVNLYYTYYMRIEVAVVVTVPDVDPFYNISGSRLFVEENLSDSPLMGVKTPATDSAGFNLTKQGIYNVTMAHFADTSADEDNKSALILADGQTDNGVIYLDKSAGGLLVVYPTPYYINVANISLWTSQPHSEKVLIGNDLSGKPIYDTVSYTIGFTQMVYNEDLKYYQPYISTTGTTPQMISSWSKAEGYKWTGKYYFKTSIVSSTHVSHRLSDGTKFEISVSIQGESNAKAITETMTIQAKYRNSFVINPEDTVENFAVCTMTQTQYQALGTTAVYDVAFPIDCVPNYSAITLNGTAIVGKVVETKHAIVRVDTVAQTLSVYLKANSSSIGADIEVRIPYQRPGDYVNPYLSVVIVPVYFELDELDVVNHYESRLQITHEEKINLQYRASFKYDSAVYNSSLSAKMTSFNNNLKTSNLISYDFETPGQITLEFSYTYVDGIPVISKNSILRYIKTFYYDIVDVKPLVQRTEYLAVGTSATYTFNNWDPMHVAKLYAEGSGSNSTTINGLWETNITRLNNNNVAITVSLVNKNGSMENHEAYEALVDAGKIVINIFSTADRVNSQLELTIIPVYFTFTEFKLQNNPVNPIVALSTPTVVTVEAGGISCVEDPTVSNAISQFNTELLNAQNNLSNISSFTFNRVANDDGVLNFSFDSTKRSIVRADSSNPITATSYLLVSAYVSYVKGIPTLNTKGQKVTTYLPVATYGEDFGSDGTLMPDLETAPNGRTRTIAQAIGTSVRYNIALAGVAYDSRLDKYEIKADGSFVDWNKDSGWNAIFNVKESTVAVNLKENINLFNKVLTVMAYSRTGELMYVLNIVPAYFTVEQLLLADHIDESPVMIKDEPNWLNNLALDFKTTYSNSLISVFEKEIENFKNTLKTSSLVSRLDDAGYITLYTGVNYEDGIPTLVNLVNAKTTVQNTFRYVLYDGIPENTKAQALGQEVVYNVNRPATVIKISTGKDPEGKDIWKNHNSTDFADSGWWIENLDNPRCIEVGLSSDVKLIGQTIRIGIFVNDDDEEPAYILNIVPAYFTVEDITVAGQSVEDRDIYFYYGDEFDSPEDLIFDAIYGKYLNTSDVVSEMSVFEYELQNTKADLIVREYDADAMSGNLHVTVYLDYTTGNPTIVPETTENPCVVRLDVDFNYTVFGKTSFDSEFPPMPNGPRTRTEIQAVGTTASYTIDLNKNLSLDVNYLKDDANRGWKISFEENVLTVELRPSKVEQLLANDVVFEFYVGYEVVYVLTIQPVLFEVVGIETNRPEQPVAFAESVDNLQYRVVAKYNNAVSYQGSYVISYIESLNQKLNSKDSLLEIENIEDQYLKLSAAFDYGVAGDKLRKVPALLNVENYPLQTVESYVEIETNGDSTGATHYQAVGTTVYYNLGIDYENASIPSIMIGGQPNSGEVTGNIKLHGTSYALEVELQPRTNLLGKDIVIVIDNDASIFTMTIKPVLFLVEGFDVINHPEQHMWLINSLEQKEDVDNLLYRVRARYSSDQALQDGIKEEIEKLNKSLAVYNDQTRQWEAGSSAGILETYTIGGAYLVVRAGIEYTNGLPIIVDVNHVKPTQVVRDVFKYARYSDRIDSNNLVKPNIPRSRTVELTIGHSAVYTLDFEELAGFSGNMIALYENTDSTNADDDSMLVSYENGSNGWQVSVENNNQLCVTLQPNADLVNRELKVFIYYEKGHVNDEPNSYDVENVAFILTIRPVWFKVTGIALNSYPDDEIKVTTIDHFMTELSTINDTYFVPTFEYSDAVLEQAVIGAELQAKMDAFTDEFKSSPFVTITRTREDASTYHFQVTTAVTYEPFTGEAVLADDAARLIWNSFKVVVDPSATQPVEERVENQAIGTTKTYYIDADILADVDEITNGTNYTVKWDKNQTNINYVTVTLNDNVTVGTPVEVAIGDDFVLKIYPVYFEILGFETVAHPEREVWVVSPYTVEDLKYRVITTEISKLFTPEVLAAVEQTLADLNLTLNSSAPVSITTDSNQNIIFDAAVNYTNDGYPEIVEITKDKRNVVESIIPYRIWSANIRPKPEHPSVVGSTKSNQVIGGTKAYTLKRIRGQVFYQHLWVENGGELVTPFADSSNGTTQVYEGLSIMVDPARNSMKIQLAADAKYLAQPIRVYLPYMTLVKGKDVWYSHCIEITPLLFELKGWTITARDPHAELLLYKHSDNPYYLLLTKDSNPVTTYKFDALINYSKSVTDANLINQIKNAERQLEVLAENFIEPVLLTDGNIRFNGLQLNRLVAADVKTDNIVGLSTYIVYENGVPELVDSSKTLVSNQILISTGYSIDEWNPNVELGAGSLYQVQAIGTSQTYDININGAGKIFTNQIKAVNANGNPISIPGEQSNLVMIECEDFGEGSAELKVDLAPVVALRNEKIEIRIPYAEDIDAENPEAYYTLSITPVIFAIEGFYLEAAADNNLELSSKDVPLILHVQASYSEDVNLRNMVNYMLKDFESRLNQAIQSDVISFTITNVSGSQNAEILGQSKVIHQKVNKTAVDIISAEIKIGYNSGIPQLIKGNEHINVLTDEVFNYELTVNTMLGFFAKFPGWKSIEEGNLTNEDGNKSGNKFLQAIGTSRLYGINVKDLNITFYHQYIKVFNAGAILSGLTQNEYFALVVKNAGYQSMDLEFSLRATADTINDWIDIRIPYTVNDSEGSGKWFYYSVKIKPVLFEIKSWKLKLNRDLEESTLVDEVVLHNSAVELYFAPEVVTGPLNLSCYMPNELEYIKNAINRLEIEINTYDELISDGYEYIVINNLAQEGYQVNYTIFRDNNTNKTYMVRDSNRSSTTVMDLSAYIAYNVSDANKNYVDSAHAVTSYIESDDAHRVNGQIMIHTTDNTTEEESDRSKVFITQENARQLMSLRNDVDYILMSDIYLDEIAELDNGRWKPVPFPTNATFDGNNFRIFLNSTGFDLSGKPTNIGLFTEIPKGSVVKNVQIAFEQGVDINNITQVKIDLGSYTEGQVVNIGLLAGINNGIVTNCAVLSEWQFKMRNSTSIYNPVTKQNFEKILPFNKDGKMFDDQYFYLVKDNVVTQVYDEHGYGFAMTQSANGYELALDSATNKPYIKYDNYHNVVNWTPADRTIVANYDDYSPIMMGEFGNTVDKKYDAKSAAKLHVEANNDKLSVTLGGLIGTNNYMVTNSRVLIDVELYGPAKSTDAGHIDEISVLNSTVGGFIGVNAGTITTSFFRDGSVINNANADVLKGNVSLLGGFVGHSTGTIMQSYAMGCSVGRADTGISYAGAVRTIRNSLGAFVHLNGGTINDCMVNMVIDKSGTEGEAGGFVYQNTNSGRINNCVENNNILVQGGSTMDYYSPFIVINGQTKTEKVVTTNLSNLIYAGNAISASFSDDWLKPGILTNLAGSSKGFNNIENYSSFSMGSGKENSADCVSAKNTVWEMTSIGPKLRAANDIAISYRKYAWNSSPYLYNPGTEKNPYVIWTAEQFNDYIYGASPYATNADEGVSAEKALTNIEKNRQSNHIRLIDNITLNGIQDTYKVVYTGTFEGNGLTMKGISLDTSASDLATMGLFGKTEYATIRNINFEIGKINSIARYVGGIAGIAINTSFVDVKVTSNEIKGANIVGGFVGLNVVNDPKVEYYNLNSSVSATASFQKGQTDVSAEFTSGIEYVHQTLYARLKPFDSTYEQGFGTAGSIFGFITSNPNNYRTVDAATGKETITARNFVKTIQKTDASGKPYGEPVTAESSNSEAEWFLKDSAGKVINDNGVYYKNQIILRRINGAVNKISANVAGGLIGIMDETIELHNPKVTRLSGLTGKYYLGGIVGINLGKIVGGTTEDEEGNITTYNAMSLSSWTVASSAGSSADSPYIFRNTNDINEAKYLWGMSVGAVAGYNNGLIDNTNSGVIQNIHVNANVLAPSDGVKIYAIGGIVGANGVYGYVDNAVNTNNNVKNDRVEVTSSQAQKVGYYFGSVIGRSDVASSALTKSNDARMMIMQMDFPTNFDAKYISKEYFGYNKNVANHFKVVNEETSKIQTVTLTEYREWLLTTITSQDLPTRIEMLNPWVRTLPTVVKKTKINNKEVWVEVFEENEDEKLNKVKEFKDWIETNEIFESWDGLHLALKNNVVTEYYKYLEYSAVSDEVVAEQDENTFISKLEQYRATRDENALEFFTYQYQIGSANSVATKKNAEFKWEDYQSYLTLKKFVDKNENLNSYNSHYDMRMTYGNTVANILDVDNKEGYFEINQTGEVTMDNYEIICDMFYNYEKAKDKSAIKFTNEDPLQAYINYIVNLNAGTFKINDYVGTLAQEYYYMMYIYGKNYSVKEYTYSVPKNFGEVGNDGYIAYLQLSKSLLSSGTLLTIGEFIYMMDQENEIVMDNEEVWIKTGHRGNGSTRISEIGAVALEWETAANWTSEKQGTVIKQDNILQYGDNEAKQWKAFEKYNEARIYGMDIAKYKEMISLGGSLYEFLNLYEDKNEEDKNATDKDQRAARYIFSLKAEQYGWTQAQSDFIMTNFSKDGAVDMNYGLAATTTGNILGAEYKGSVRAVYENKKTQVFNSSDWFTDEDGNGEYISGEVLGVWRLPYITDAKFRNGDGTEYKFGIQTSINLFGDGTKGAALYVDIDGNKMFGEKLNAGASSSAGKDILILYEVFANGKDENTMLASVDFWRKEEDGTVRYFNIARKIVNNPANVNSSTESTGNVSDYLEEALWWKNEGFTAKEFDRIKNNAMVGHNINANGRVKLVGGQWTRDKGFTVADDWYAKWKKDDADVESGFKTEEFTPAEYTEIATGAKYVDGKWYSTYADYKLFTQLNYVTTQAVKDRTIDIDKIKAAIPDGSPFNVPFIGEDDGFGGVEYKNINNVKNIASENELANAMDFASERAAFLEMFRAGGSTADYIAWSGIKDPTAQNSFVCKIGDNNRFFRLNHYIYYMKNDLVNMKCITSDGEKPFEPADLQWVLTQSVRADIMYADITQESLTTDLVTYRRDWFNKGGVPFITYRDYCEWICIYAYDDNYQTDRGDMAEDMEEEMGGTTGDTGDTGTNEEQLKSTDGWLTIEAFAVWKRMEKYENNVEYLAKASEYAPVQTAITAPILKRQISTTVFPMIHESGNQTVDESGKVTSDKYTLPKVFNSQDDINLVAYYGWGTTNPYGEYYKEFKDTKIDLNHQRHAKDRYEYNECGNEYTILRWSKELAETGSIYDYATDYINDAKFALKCDSNCGGLNGNDCNNTMHAKYQVKQWDDRYIFHYNCSITINLRLDEVLVFCDREYLPKKANSVYGDINEFGYNQLYVPYDVFKKACRQIKASYTQSGKEKGYNNYMQYWARNGSFSDICDISAYPYATTISAHGYRLINNTYLATDFWSKYDGSRDPFNGAEYDGNKKAVGW